MAKAISNTRETGFSLVEMAVVIAVIGVLLGAISLGNSLYQTASYTQIGSSFVRGWQVAYDSYLERTGDVPGSADDDGLIDGTSCNADMLDEFLAAGVKLPQGRAEGENDRYVYQDSNGNPQAIQVCLRQVGDWAVPGERTGDFVERPRNVLVFRQLTPSLARHLDSTIDGRIDARFGAFRRQGRHNTGSNSAWGLDDDDPMSGGQGDEAQVDTLTALYVMRR
jgi:prepilin-type N-terminal cleavage/methylation domain-containing protein